MHKFCIINRKEKSRLRLSNYHTCPPLIMLQLSLLRNVKKIGTVEK